MKSTFVILPVQMMVKAMISQRASLCWHLRSGLQTNRLTLPDLMNYLLGNKNIVDCGVFAEVEDSTDPELTQQIELVLPEHIQQEIYKLITDNIDQAKAIEAMAQF